MYNNTFKTHFPMTDCALIDFLATRTVVTCRISFRAKVPAYIHDTALQSRNRSTKSISSLDNTRKQILLLELLHHSRPMLGAGSSSGVELFQVFMGTHLWQDGADQQVFHGLFTPHSHVVCPSSLNPHFFIRNLHRPVPVRRRFRLDQVDHVSLEPGGSDSLGLNESLCGVVWRWLDQRVSRRVRALPSRGSTEWSKLCKETTEGPSSMGDIRHIEQ